MAITIDGAGTITGVVAGGLPDASVTNDDLATGIASSKLTGALPALDGSALTALASGNLSGALPAISGASLTNLPAGGVDGITSSANATAISISADEEVTMPSQPAFNAYMSSAVGCTVGSWATIPFQSERFDQGSNFASNTFTAPITGRYQLSVFLRINNLRNGASYYGLRINTSNKNYELTYGAGGFDSDVNHWSIAFDILADMDSGDTAYCSFLQSEGASTAFEAHLTFFSGYLVA